MAWFEGFEERRFNVNSVQIFARIGGPADAPPLLMLHGFPQTHAIWHRVAQVLAEHFSLVLPDLRGYGDRWRASAGSRAASAAAVRPRGRRCGRRSARRSPRSVAPRNPRTSPCRPLEVAPLYCYPALICSGLRALYKCR